MMDENQSQNQNRESKAPPQEPFEQLIIGAPIAIVGIDQQGRILMVNTALQTLFGYNRAELVGQPLEILLPELYRRAHVGYRATFFAQPGARPMGHGRDLTGLHKKGFEIPIEVGLSMIQIHDQPVALAFITDLRLRLKQEARIRLLQGVTATLGEALTLDQVVSVIRSRVFEFMGGDASTLGLLTPDGQYVQAAPDSLRDGIPQRSLPVPLSTPAPITDAIRTRQALWIESADELQAQYPEMFAQVDGQTPPQAIICVPLAIGDRVLGGLRTVFSEPKPFDADELGLMITLAEQCAQALERARLYET